MHGLALRGFSGAGQNMYIYPSILRGFGGTWFKGKELVVNSPEAVRALEWYVERADAVRAAGGAQLELAGHRRRVLAGHDRLLHRRTLVGRGASTTRRSRRSSARSAMRAGPPGPSGKRVTSIWNWGFPVNAALSDKAKRATWLFITWAASAETQARTSWKFAGPAKRSGLNRTASWKSPEFAAAMQGAGDNFIKAALDSLEQDTDVEWRPRVPQWPAIGEAMATSIQSALVGQKKPKEALDEAQTRIQQALKS